MDPARASFQINVSGSLFIDNTTALFLRHNMSASIRDSTITGGGVAIDLQPDNVGYVECIRCVINKTGNMAVRASVNFVGISSPLVVLSNSSITDRAAEAIVANSGATVRVSDTTITNNATGIAGPGGGAGGQVISLGNNRLFGNGTDGSFTSIVPMQ